MKGFKKGSALLFSLLLTAMAAAVVGSVGAYYAHSAKMARLYQSQNAERFAAEYAIESVMADISGMVIDPTTSEGEQIVGKATNFDELQAELLKKGGEQTLEVGDYQVKVSFDPSQIQQKVDVDGDGKVDEDSRLLTIEAIVYDNKFGGGMLGEGRRIRQTLQIDLVRIGKDVQTTMPIFNYVYFANNYGHLESKGIVANGDVGSNDRLTIDGATVNGFVWAHGAKEDDPAAVVLNNTESRPPKMWPYVTYMKRVTSAYKTDGHDFYTQVRPTDPNHGVSNGVPTAIEWKGGYAYPGGSDDFGTIGDDGIYIPSSNPYADTEPTWSGGDTPTALDPSTRPADYGVTRPTKPTAPTWTGGTRPTLSPATRPLDLSATEARPTLTGSAPTAVADPGANPLDAFWSSMPLINSANQSKSKYYTAKKDKKGRVTGYEFQYNSYKTDWQNWRNSTVGKSWSTAIPDMTAKTYYKNKNVKAANFYVATYETALNNWAKDAKAHPERSSVYNEWKKKSDAYEQYQKDLKEWNEKNAGVVEAQAAWDAKNTQRKKDQAAWDTQKKAQEAWDAKRATYDAQYAAWEASLTDWKKADAEWSAANAAVQEAQAAWDKQNAARNSEISSWNTSYSTYQKAHDEWQTQYDAFDQSQREMAEQVNNGYFEVDLTKDLLTQNEYWNEDYSAKSRQPIISVSTNVVEMPNLSDDDFYRMYCQTNEVVITNVYGVAVKQKGGTLVCRNRYQNITEKGTTEEDIAWKYTYSDRVKRVGTKAASGHVFSETSSGSEQTLTRTLTSVAIDGGWRGSFYPFRDIRCATAEKGSVILIGTAKYPITVNGPVYFDGDVVIRGFVSGQGSIYAGRNVHIIGDITYLNPPSWPHSNTGDERNAPQTVAKNNAGRDLLLLAARGNIVVGDYSQDTWMQYFEQWVDSVGRDGGESVVSICNSMQDQDIGYPSDMLGFNRKYTNAEAGEGTWDGGYKVEIGYEDKPYKTESALPISATIPGKGWGIWATQNEYYRLSVHEAKGIRFYESKLGNTILTAFMQSGSTESSLNWSSSLLQRLIWKWLGYENTTVNTGDTSFNYAQTSSAISGNSEAGDITHIDASLFANHGIFGLVGGNVNKKFTLNGGIICRDEGLLPTMKARISGAEVWLNYDLRLRSDSAEGNRVVAPSFSRKSAARTELKVSIKSWQQL